MRKPLSWSVYVMAITLAVGCAADRSENPPAGGDDAGTVTPGRIESGSRNASVATTTAGVAVAPFSPQLSLILTAAGAALGALADHLAKRRRIRRLEAIRQPWTAAERRHYQNTGEAPTGKPPRPAVPAEPTPVIPDTRAAAQQTAQLQQAA